MQQVRASMPGIVMIIVSLVFLSQSILMEKAYIFDPAEGSFFPALISLIMLLCGVTVIVQSLYAKNKRAVEETEEDSEGTFTFKDYKYILTFFMLSVIYVILLYYITFFPATFLYLSASMIYLRNVSWKLNIAVSLGSIVVIYLLFSQVFKIIFP